MVKQWGAVLYGLGADEIHTGLVKYSLDPSLQKFIPTAAEFRAVARPPKRPYDREPAPLPNYRRPALPSTHADALRSAHAKLRSLADDYDPATCPANMSAVAHRQLYIQRKLARMRGGLSMYSRPAGFLDPDEVRALADHQRTGR